MGAGRLAPIALGAPAAPDAEAEAGGVMSCSDCRLSAATAPVSDGMVGVSARGSGAAIPLIDGDDADDAEAVDADTLMAAAALSAVARMAAAADGEAVGGWGGGKCAATADGGSIGTTNSGTGNTGWPPAVLCAAPDDAASIGGDACGGIGRALIGLAVALAVANGLERSGVTGADRAAFLKTEVTDLLRAHIEFLLAHRSSILSSASAAKAMKR